MSRCFASGATPEKPGTASMLAALLFYVVAYFIMFFFDTALVGAALMRMEGQNPRLSDGLRTAWGGSGSSSSS